MGQCTPVGSSRVGLFLTLQMPRWPLDFEQRGSREQGAEPVSILCQHWDGVLHEAPMKGSIQGKTGRLETCPPNNIRFRLEIY